MIASCQQILDDTLYLYGQVGDGLPPMYTTHETLQAVKAAGFDLVLAKDVADNGDGMTPWYATLAGGWSLSGLRMSWLGRQLTHTMVRALHVFDDLC